MEVAPKSLRTGPRHFTLVGLSQTLRSTRWPAGVTLPAGVGAGCRGWRGRASAAVGPLPAACTACLGAWGALSPSSPAHFLWLPGHTSGPVRTHLALAEAGILEGKMICTEAGARWNCVALGQCGTQDSRVPSQQGVEEPLMVCGWCGFCRTSHLATPWDSGHSRHQVYMQLVGKEYKPTTLSSFRLPFLLLKFYLCVGNILLLF